MRYISKKAIAFAALFTVLCPASFPAGAQPVHSTPASANPGAPAADAPQNQLDPASNSGPDRWYEQAKQELPTELYVLYRITERLSRANGLDEQAWRVQVAPSYDPNLFAATPNSVPVYRGLLDQLDGDVDGLACVVAREMAHHTQQHQAPSPAEQAQQLQQFMTEATNEMTAEIEDAVSSARRASVGSSLLGSLGGLLGGLAGPLGGIAGSAIGGLAGSAAGDGGQSRIMNAQTRYQEAFQAKVAEFQKQQTELAQAQGLEADAIGYRYMATAGFNPEGCVRAINALDKLASTAPTTMPIGNPSGYGMGMGTDADEAEMAADQDLGFDSMIPAPQPINTGSFTAASRVEALRQAMQEYPSAALVSKGRNQLTLRYQPLTYSLSTDGELRVNSQQGGTQNVDNLFPN